MQTTTGAALTPATLIPGGGVTTPTLRGMLHVAGLIATVPAGIALIFAASPGPHRWAVAVFVVSLAAMFATSSTYHRLARTGRARELWRRADHAMIFCLVAGTYTPIAVIGLGGSIAVASLVAVWVAAAAGVAAKLFAFDTLGNRASALYLIIGWSAALAVPQLSRNASMAVVALLAAGGLCYTVGVAVLATNRPNPNPRVFGFHEVWHAFTLIAAGCHGAAIALLG